MRPNPLSDAVTFLTAPGLPTVVFWVLLLGSCGFAVAAWLADRSQRTGYAAGMWLLRLTVGVMWWEQSLWKIPPNYDGLVYWMKQMVDHAAIPLQGALVGSIVIPNIAIFGPIVYATEVLIGASLMLGLLTRVGATIGALMVVNLWLGLYSAPGEWPWTYGFLLIIQLLFVLDPPGRNLGADVILGRRLPVLLGWSVLA
ncbi:MAG TPA: DoxX family membrane protein [Rhodopila sp.]|nr:DoxX family membrane protein [Rhodopila sp.]